MAIGGKGGVSGAGGLAHVINAAHIQTDGLLSNGILAQSLGGGGGNGGAVGLTAVTIGGDGGASGVGGEVLVENKAGSTILTKGMMSNGILAQSIGGGGGNGGSNALFGAVSIGGSGGKSGDGGHVTVRNDGMIETRDFGSVGLFAQSVGGSGGTGGSNFVSLVSVGGKGGAAGNGGQVDVNNTGQILTSGVSADAIRAQSVGGGGGAAGGKGADKSMFTVGLGLLVSVGGQGNSGGDGGAVNVTNSATLVTKGDKANGVFAQSIGAAAARAAMPMVLQPSVVMAVLRATAAMSLSTTSLAARFGRRA